MIRTVVLAFVVAALSACTRVTTPSPTTTQSGLERLRYARDPRSGLCFALLESTTYYGYRVLALTAVPCDRLPDGSRTP